MMVERNKGFTPILLIIIVVAVLAVAGGGSYLALKKEKDVALPLVVSKKEKEVLQQEELVAPSPAAIQKEESKSAPPSVQPPPLQQKPVLESMSDEIWCPAGKRTTEVSITGKETIEEVLGIESVQIGSVVCRACHSKMTEAASNVVMEEWSDKNYWIARNLPGTWGCSKLISNKTISADGWLDQPFNRETWETPAGTRCAKQNGIYQLGSASLCE